MVELPSLLVTIFSLLVNNSFAFVIAPPWADDNTNPCSEVRIEKQPPPPKVLREGVKNGYSKVSLTVTHFFTHFLEMLCIL